MFKSKITKIIAGLALVAAIAAVPVASVMHKQASDQPPTPYTVASDQPPTPYSPTVG